MKPTTSKQGNLGYTELVGTFAVVDKNHNSVALHHTLMIGKKKNLNQCVFQFNLM